MQIIVSGQNLAMTEALKTYAEKKIGKIVHYFAEAIENGKVEMVYHDNKSPEKANEAKVTVHVHGAILQAKEESSDMYAAIDLLFEKIEKQLKKYKEKLKDRKGDKVSQKIEKIDKRTADEDSAGQQEIIISKQRLKPMSPDEAMLQLQSLKLEFLAFMNDKSQEMNVIYKRKDGNFGLIEPEF
ncbi:MAG: ribosome-associated translation inhibitor RaiA [Candidatus Margulisbacteria bacterium]|nr:ribosome-associated translation inhibitor RaiA [Candidatus Margulisiibacteriota bacterium]